ncbi:MAG TPA: hypothetical protein PK760_03310 [Flavobacteriales bacterium]|nr:hypothetical protein [Flavobacteriales bacterium]
MRAIANLLSILLHPLLMPVLTLAMAMRLDPWIAYFIEPQQRLLVLGIVALMTVAFPLTSALLLIRSGMLSGLQMKGRRERIAPYIMTLVYYGLTGFLIARTPLDPIVFGFVVGASVALLLTTIVTLWWKISAHMIGVGGMVGAFAALHVVHQHTMILPICAAIVLSGAVGTARLLTSDHTQTQVGAGFALGVASTFVCALVKWPFVW